MTMTDQQFQLGDRIVHTGKPEWGVGVISMAASTLHEGAPCQRITARFDRAGLKTLSTAFATLEHADHQTSIRDHENTPDTAPPNPLLTASPRETQDIMVAIPESATDPFATPAERLRATLELYRFSDQGGGLIDWAVMQSGFGDPLTHFTRHDLEAYFELFGKNLHAHLSKMVSQAKSVPAAELVKIAQNAPDAGKSALQRLHRAR